MFVSLMFLMFDVVPSDVGPTFLMFGVVPSDVGPTFVLLLSFILEDISNIILEISYKFECPNSAQLY